MVNRVNMAFGKYILYELNGAAKLAGDGFDPNVKLIKTFDSIKGNKLGITQESMDRVLSKNSDLFLCFDGDMPLGMMWGHRGSCYIRGPGIPLLYDEGTVYWFWIFTLPEARGKNVFKRLTNSFFHHYKGAKNFVALVDPRNTIMRNQINKLGFIENKLYTYAKLGTNSLVFEKSVMAQQSSFHFESGNRHHLPVI